VTPRNILALQEGTVRRWVVADWGLVRTPKGMTTSPLTLPGQMYGTEGFVAPEIDDDAHEADARVDVYSLGRVAAWLLTGTWPKQNIALIPQEPKWRRLVEAMTDAEPALRLESMDQVMWMLDVEFNPNLTVLQRVSPLIERIDKNLSVAALIMRYSRDFADDHNLFFDYVPRIPQEAVARFIRTDPGTVQAVVSAMLNHILAMTDWGHRDFNELNTSMGWLETVARAAESVSQLGVLEATASALFTADARHERYRQRYRTRAWLNSLQGDAAAVVARALKANPKAVQWYLNEGWSPSMNADQRIRQALGR
jgi:serine/threonine protein kinase